MLMSGAGLEVDKNGNGACHSDFGETPAPRMSRTAILKHRAHGHSLAGEKIAEHLSYM